MKWILALFIVFLVSCTTVDQTVTTKPVVQQTEDAVEPQVLAPEAKAPQEIFTPEDKTARQGIQQATISSTPPTQEQSCKQICESDCEQDAHNACSQEERSQCKTNCGDIVDPSACTQACTFLNQPSSCKSQLEQFCKARCVELCH